MEVTETSGDHFEVEAAAHRPGISGHGDGATQSRVIRALYEILELARRDGAIRKGIKVDDLVLLMTTAPNDQPPAVRQRWLALVLAGLTTDGGTQYR